MKDVPMANAQQDSVNDTSVVHDPLLINEQVPENNTFEAAHGLHRQGSSSGSSDGNQGPNERARTVSMDHSQIDLVAIDPSCPITYSPTHHHHHHHHYQQDQKHSNPDPNSGTRMQPSHVTSPPPVSTSAREGNEPFETGRALGRPNYAHPQRPGTSPQAANEIPGHRCDRVDTVNVLPADVSRCEEIRREKGYYPIKDFEKKGCALILRNDFVESKKETSLPGYEKDEQNMEKLLEGLDCNPIDVQINKKAEEIKPLLTRFVREATVSPPSYIVVVILSHGGKKGDKQVFYGSDSKPVMVDFVLDSFNNENAKHLQNIPKLFIFQFCRGIKTDYGIRRASSGPSVSVSTTPLSNRILPVYSDQFVAYPAHDDYTSMVGPHGSWFINAIINIFMEFAKDEHVADLFTMVNKEVKYKTGDLFPESANHRQVISTTEASLPAWLYRRMRSIGQWIGLLGLNEKPITCKQMSVSVSSLTEKLYLFPGYHPEGPN